MRFGDGLLDGDRTGDKLVLPSNRLEFSILFFLAHDAILVRQLGIV